LREKKSNKLLFTEISSITKSSILLGAKKSLTSFE